MSASPTARQAELATASLSHTRLPRAYRFLPVVAAERVRLFPERIQLALFDLNGTVADTEEAHREALRLALVETTGLPISRAQWSRIKTAWHMSDLQASRTALRALRRAFPDEKHLAAISPTAIAKRQRELIGAHLSLGTPKQLYAVDSLFDNLTTKNIPLTLVTGSEQKHAARLIRHIPAGSHIAEIIGDGSDFRLRSKPYPDLYREALTRRGVSPSAALAFEDTVKGALAAYNAGISIVVRVPDREREFLARLLSKRSALSPGNSQTKIYLVPDWSAVEC